METAGVIIEIVKMFIEILFFLIYQQNQVLMINKRLTVLLDEKTMSMVQWYCDYNIIMLQTKVIK
jgi:hypothetical protein